MHGPQPHVHVGACHHTLVALPHHFTTPQSVLFRSSWPSVVQMLARTHTHTRARARIHTHTHTHTTPCQVVVGTKLGKEYSWCIRALRDNDAHELLGLSFGVLTWDKWSKRMSNEYSIPSLLFDCYTTVGYRSNVVPLSYLCDLVVIAACARLLCVRMAREYAPCFGLTSKETALLHRHTPIHTLTHTNHSNSCAHSGNS
jgi:hypothetical protein